MSTKFEMVRDINGYNGFGLAFTDTGKQFTLSANAEQHFTVPTPNNLSQSTQYSPAYFLAIFNYTSGTDVWVCNGATATVSGGSPSATTSQLNPNARLVKAGDVLSFITADTTAEVWVGFYVL